LFVLFFLKKKPAIEKPPVRQDEKFVDLQTQKATKQEKETSMSVLTSLFGDSVRAYKPIRNLPASLLAIESKESDEEDEMAVDETIQSTVTEIANGNTWSLGTETTSTANVQNSSEAVRMELIVLNETDLSRLWF